MQNVQHLSSLINERLEQAPDSVAFIDNGRNITVAEFDVLCRRTAAWLKQEGIGEGDLVAVWLANRIEWLALFFGLAQIGAILVSVNTRYRSEEVTHILSKSEASMLILQLNFRKIDFPAVLKEVNPAALPKLKKIALIDGTALPPQLLGLPTVNVDLSTLAPLAREDSSDPSRCAILFTTSGTTKGPKLVMHPQRTLADHARRCAKAYGLDQANAVMLAALPFCGVFGLNGALGAFAGGAPVVLLDAFDAETAADLINRHQVTHTFGSDEMYRRLADSVPGERPFPSARVFGFGAFTSSFNDYAKAAWQRGIPLYGLYGSSEVLALFSMQPADLPLDKRIEGGGRPVAGDEAKIRIRDVKTQELVPVGTSGEIEILAPSNFIGYLNNPEATAGAIREDGFFRTGDLGYLRDDGTFVYETRMGDAIRLGGFLVNPVEIEEALKTIDGIADAQVVAIDIDGQMRVVAFVIKAERHPISEADVITRSRAIIAPFKVPARVWFVNDYPVTLSSNGVKTQRNKLRDMALARLAAP